MRVLSANTILSFNLTYYMHVIIKYGLQWGWQIKPNYLYLRCSIAYSSKYYISNQQIIIIFFRWNYVFHFWSSRSRLWPQLLVHSTACARAKQTRHYECTSHVLRFLCTRFQVIRNIYYIHFQRFSNLTTIMITILLTCRNVLSTTMLKSM